MYERLKSLVKRVFPKRHDAIIAALHDQAQPWRPGKGAGTIDRDRGCLRERKAAPTAESHANKTGVRADNIMRPSLQWIIILLLLLAGATASVADQSSMQHFGVAPSGNDANDCISAPCATFQHAVDLCPAGGYCAIDVAPGAYSQKTNVFYYKAILIQGPTDAKGQCADPGGVTVDDRTDGVAGMRAIFWVQDHAILTVRCMTLRAYGRYSIGVAARQFAIGDVNDVDFLQFPEGTSIEAQDTSKINVKNPMISGNASRFAFASNLSQITISGRVRLASGLRFDVAFVSSVHKSVVSLYASTIEGGEGMSGASYQCADSNIDRSTALPGGDVPYPDSFDCTISGLASDHDPLSALRAQFDEKFAAAGAGFDEKLAGVSRQLRTIRVELFAAIGSFAVLLVAAIITMLLLYRPHRRSEARKTFGEGNATSLNNPALRKKR